jgi:nucleoside-diphosphate-sugar epimerase
MVDFDLSRFSLAGKKVLITGGGGFVGSHLVEYLLRKNAVVAVMSRTRGKLKGLIDESQYMFFSCDLLDRNGTDAAVASFQPEIVFHLASHPDHRESVEQATASLQCNALSTLNILESFRKTNGELFVYGDSCKVYGEGHVPYRESMPMNPVSSYAIGKAAGWHLCTSYLSVHGVATVSIRPTMIHGPRQGFNLITYVVNCVLDGKREVILDGGSQTRDLLWVEDAIQAFALAACKGRCLAGNVINIGGGCEQSIEELARTVLEILDSHIPVVCCPARVRPTEMQRSYCDNAEAERYLDWRPTIDLRTALQKTIAALMQDAVEETSVTRSVISSAAA